MIVLLMGVSGSGKTTVGRLLAARLGVPFVEGDAFHPPANVEKMRAGEPLDDRDREPWLAALAERIDRWAARGEGVVLSCSALKRAYRERLASGHPEVVFVYLAGSPERLRERLRGRRGHFMPAALLESQLAALEPPAPDERAIEVAVDPPPEIVVEGIVQALAPHGPREEAP